MRYSSLRFTPLLFVFFVGVFAACSTPLPVKGCDDPGPVRVRGQETGIEFCTNGPRYRARALACPLLEPPAGQCHLDPMNMWSCEANVDCATPDEASNACLALALGNCMCVSSCITDDDCGEGRFCLCEEPTSTCHKALCRSGADCDDGRLCASARFLDSGHDVGLACQSEFDTCLIDSECAENFRCIFDGLKGYRLCSDLP